MTADDLGLSAGVTRGVLEAHRHGVVRSTSLLVTFPAADGYVMTLGFDGEVQDRSTDLRPDLPLVLAW